VDRQRVRDGGGPAIKGDQGRYKVSIAVEGAYKASEIASRIARRIQGVKSARDSLLAASEGGGQFLAQHQTRLPPGQRRAHHRTGEQHQGDGDDDPETQRHGVSLITLRTSRAHSTSPDREEFSKTTGTVALSGAASQH